MIEKIERVVLRVEPDFLVAVDDWRRVQPDIPSRSEAIRRLVELGMRVKSPSKRKPGKASVQPL